MWRDMNNRGYALKTSIAKETKHLSAILKQS